MFGTILVPLDGSALARRAIPYAAALAKATRARLILMHAYVSERKAAVADTELDVIVQLSELAGDLRTQGINASTWLLYDDPGAAIVQAVTNLHGNLIVMSTHGRGGLSGLIHGSVTAYVLRNVSVPVVLVTGHCQPRWEDAHPIGVIVPLDGSSFAETALGPARELARLLQAELVLLRALEPGADRSPTWPLQWGHVDNRPLDEARSYLEEIAAPMRAAGLPVETRAEIADAPAAIVRLAHERAAALVVMATHGRGALSRLVIESVTMEALQQLRSPILLVRPARNGTEFEAEPGLAEPGPAEQVRV